MSRTPFSLLGAFTTFLAYHRIRGNAEFQQLYAAFNKNEKIAQQSRNPHRVQKLIQYTIGTLTSVFLGGYIVGEHGYLIADELTKRGISETVAMVWLMFMGGVALFGVPKLGVVREA